MNERPRDPEERPPLPPPDDDRAIRLRGVVLFVAGLAGLLLVSAALSAAFGLHFKGELQGRDPPPSPLAEANARDAPPPPRLQASPPRDMAELRAVEGTILGSHGWADQEAGIARIPIERAIDLVAARPDLIVRRPGAAEDAGTGALPDGGTP
jgi:hypothetical protein